MKYDINVGDQVMIPNNPYPIVGKVIEVDDDPFDYAELKIEVLGACGPVVIWKSCRLARKLC